MNPTSLDLYNSILRFIIFKNSISWYWGPPYTKYDIIRHTYLVILIHGLLTGHFRVFILFPAKNFLTTLAVRSVVLVVSKFISCSATLTVSQIILVMLVMNKVKDFINTSKLWKNVIKDGGVRACWLIIVGPCKEKLSILCTGGRLTNEKWYLK